MTDKKLSSEELYQLVEQDKADRLENCRNEIEAILQKHKCQLVALPQINIEGKVIAEVHIRILP